MIKKPRQWGRVIWHKPSDGRRQLAKNMPKWNVHATFYN